METRYLTVKEISGRLGISEARVKQIIRSGRLPAQRVGARLLLVLERDVEAFEQMPRDKGGRPPVKKNA
jgi:excisionase family DNA binding protein